jgi:BlaI family penicillinase repressor
LSETTPRPTEAELAILAVLWQRGRATVRDVFEALYERDGGHYTTALKLMQVMYAKGLVQRDDRQRIHVFRAAVTREAARSKLLGPIVDRLFSGSSVDLVLSVLGTGAAPAPDEIAQVRELLDRLERERNAP